MTSVVLSNNQQPDCISCNKYYGHEIFSNTNGKYCSKCFFRAYPEESKISLKNMVCLKIIIPLKN